MGGNWWSVTKKGWGELVFFGVEDEIRLDWGGVTGIIATVVRSFEGFVLAPVRWWCFGMMTGEYGSCLWRGWIVRTRVSGP